MKLLENIAENMDIGVYSEGAFFYMEIDKI